MSVFVEDVGDERFVIGFDSNLLWVYDPEGQWSISTQSANFFEDGRPTIETILQRPLYGASTVPIGTIYPWGLDENSQENTGTCVIDMIYECALKRSNHAYKHCFANWETCKVACERARKKVSQHAPQSWKCWI